MEEKEGKPDRRSRGVLLVLLLLVDGRCLHLRGGSRLPQTVVIPCGRRVCCCSHDHGAAVPAGVLLLVSNVEVDDPSPFFSPEETPTTPSCSGSSVSSSLLVRSSTLSCVHTRSYALLRRPPSRFRWAWCGCSHPHHPHLHCTNYRYRNQPQTHGRGGKLDEDDFSKHGDSPDGTTNKYSLKVG